MCNIAVIKPKTLWILQLELKQWIVSYLLCSTILRGCSATNKFSYTPFDLHAVNVSGKAASAITASCQQRPPLCSEILTKFIGHSCAVSNHGYLINGKILGLLDNKHCLWSIMKDSPLKNRWYSRSKKRNRWYKEPLLDLLIKALVKFSPSNTLRGRH